MSKSPQQTKLLYLFIDSSRPYFDDNDNDDDFEYFDEFVNQWYPGLVDMYIEKYMCYDLDRDYFLEIFTVEHDWIGYSLAESLVWLFQHYKRKEKGLHFTFNYDSGGAETKLSEQKIAELKNKMPDLDHNAFEAYIRKQNKQLEESAAFEEEIYVATKKFVTPFVLLADSFFNGVAYKELNYICRLNCNHVRMILHEIAAKIKGKKSNVVMPD